MSRFDLFFVIYDEKNDTEDRMIADHIVQMHKMKSARTDRLYSKEVL